MGARAMIDCILCSRCGKWATTTGGGICEACAIRETHAAELATLRAELAAAKEDSARLDAIQRGNWTVHYRSMRSRWEVLTDHAHPAHRKTYTGKTARAAIDAARKGGQ